MGFLKKSKATERRREEKRRKEKMLEYYQEYMEEYADELAFYDMIKEMEQDRKMLDDEE